MDKYEYGIRASTVDGTPIMIPLAFGDDAIGKVLADKYAGLHPGAKPVSSNSIDWSTYEVVRRPVGEWETHESATGQ